MGVPISVPLHVAVVPLTVQITTSLPTDVGTTRRNGPGPVSPVSVPWAVAPVPDGVKVTVPLLPSVTLESPCGTWLGVGSRNTSTPAWPVVPLLGSAGNCGAGTYTLFPMGSTHRLWAPRPEQA